ncbi:MAG: hypothetical protein A2169_04240 [Deltaproteobacteria bacterium RBG_13_47_9]|nr:MAG: hypothetical protein A2169_04240 [Deltaproteobacteria bacterium RBG_13_47_9]
MKKLMRNRSAEKGFTLLEVIITIVIAAILASFLFTFMGSVPKSTNPVIQAQNLAAAQSVMEKITADYESYVRTGNTAAWTNIGAEGSINDSTSITYDGSLITTMPFFTVREVTVTSGDQKLVSYFIQ